MSTQAKQEKRRGGAPKGHRRYGGGMRKGQKTRKTLEKEAALALLRQKVTEQIEPLLEAQIDNAIGIKHFMLRDPKSGRFQRITDEDTIERALNEGEEGSHFWIYTKDPSVQAFTDLMNRTIGKPAEHVDVGSGSIQIRWMDTEERLLAGRKRAEGMS